VNTPTNTTLRFNEFDLDTKLRQLLRAGKEVSLNSKAFDLLAYFAANSGRLITKAELMETIWADQFVEENNLTVQVSALRKALAEDRSAPQILRTVPGKGYIFIAPVTIVEDVARGPIDVGIDKEVTSNGHRKASVARAETVDPDTDSIHNTPVPSAAEPEPTALSRFARYGVAVGLIVLVGISIYFGFLYFAPRPTGSIAVLPFVNVSDDPKTEFLSDGLTESLINSLSQSSNLKVIAQSSVFRYKGNRAQGAQQDLHSIATELGVQTLLTGRVEQRGNNLRVNVELVDGRDNTRIWGQQYDRNFADIFTIEQEIVSDVSKKLRIKLTGEAEHNLAKRYTDNLKAFEAYTMGLAYIHRRTREDLETAAKYFEQATDEDPNYALAYAGLAEVYGNLAVRGYVAPREGRQKWEESARRAVQIDPDLAEGHVMVGYFATGFVPYNFSEGDKELRRAIELSPSLAIAHLYLSLSLLRQDRMDEGLAEMLKARELDPFSAIIARQVSLYYTLTRNYEQSLENLKQADNIGPAFTSSTEVDAYVQSRMFDDGLAKIEKESLQRPSDPLLICSRGVIYAAQGKRQMAMGAIAELEAISGVEARQAQWLAKIYSQLGETGQAISELENGLANDSIGAFYEKEPVWDAIRTDPRFPGLVNRMGIRH
jgi:TolB-like protein/DNA-binding winged helix-turn-helix (wHTH) protein